MDKHIPKVIISKTTSVLDNIEDHKKILVPLKYAKKGQYKYRMGKYRVICRLMNEKLIVEAINIGHRKKIVM